LICDQHSPLATSLHKLASFDVRVGVNDFVANGGGRWRESDAEAEQGYDNLLVHVHRANVRQSRTIMESAERYVKPGGTIAIYIEHVNGETDGSNFSWELAQYVDEVLPANWIGYRLNGQFRRRKGQAAAPPGRAVAVPLPVAVVRAHIATRSSCRGSVAGRCGVDNRK
jgi:hypothetical protein